MKRSRITDDSGILSPRLALTIAGCFVLPLMLLATAPAWWSQRGVITTNASADDYALVNQGQLKNIAVAGVAEFDAHLPGGAGDTLHSLVTGWSQPNAQRKDFAPVNLGQVKNVAKGFYDRLISVRYVDDYPWATSANAPDDFAIANIGQVKELFSIDLLATDLAHDSDQNGLPDWWEKYYFGHIGLDPNAPAPRGDGLTILQAFRQGLDPVHNENGNFQIVIVSGDQQQSMPQAFLPQPLIIQVLDQNGTGLANVSVEFRVTSGGGGLATALNGSVSQLVTLQTSIDGTAQIFYRQPSGFGVTSEIVASIVASLPSASVTLHSSNFAGIIIDPSPVGAVVNARQSLTVPVVVTNASDESHEVSVSIQNGGLEQFGSSDSDQEGGPEFVWTDISTTGTRLDNISDADEGFSSVELSFAFPYFGDTYSTVYVNANGFVTLGAADGDYNYFQLPGEDAPANEIAAFHTDLNTDESSDGSGDIYYKDFGDHAVIQFDHVSRYNQDGISTFQIVLQRDGGILFYYKEMTGTLDDCVVGVQNATKDKGISVVYQQPYLKDRLAVAIAEAAPWLSASTENLSLASGETKTLNLIFSAITRESGVLKGTLKLHETDLTTEVDAKMTINEGPEVTLTSPEDGAVFVEGDNVNLLANASDLDGIAQVQFYEGATLLGQGAATGFSFVWRNSSPGTHELSARAVDNRGAARRSKPVIIEIQADTNHNGIGDDWEMQYFGNLQQTANGDFDHDGLSNIEEFRAHTNPALADTDGDGITDGDEVNVYHSNPKLADSDGDGMSDGYETQHGLNPILGDAAGDPDGDGLTNAEEAALGTDAQKWDTDGDGVSDKDDGWPLTKAVAPRRLPLMQYAVVNLTNTRIWGVNNSSDGLVYYPVDREGNPSWPNRPLPESYVSNNRFISPMTFNDNDDIAGRFIQGDELGEFSGYGGDGWPEHAIIGDTTPILVRGETIGFFGTGLLSYVLASNNARQTVVASRNAPYDGTYNAILTSGSGGSGVDLGLLTGDIKMNNQGTIAGGIGHQSILIKDGRSVAFAGDITALNDEDGEGKETVVGDGYPFIWRGGIQDMLPLLGINSNSPSAINNLDQVVGLALLQLPVFTTATLWQNGQVYDLQKLIPHRPVYYPPEWKLIKATQINDRGMILAKADRYPEFEYSSKVSYLDVLLVPVALVPDYNRDGTIDDSDYAQVTEDNPFHWWINDDDDFGELGGDDIPGQTDTSLGHVADYVTDAGTGYGQVDGMRDLVDFFPLYLNIKQLIEVFPPTADAVYKLKQADDAVNFVYTDLKPDKAGDFLRALTGSGIDNATALSTATTQQVTASGVVLNTDWLTKIKDEGQGVILLEGRAATQMPLVLEVDDSHGQKLAEVSFPMKIGDVENMFRNLNLLYVDDPFHADSSRLKEPSNYPDSLTNGKKFVFVHGFFVDSQSARGWNSEIFKRMHQSGSKAQFYGVTWHADEKDGTTVPEYHKNVDNAFATAYPLANFLKNVGGDVTVAAHSLGNVVVGSAIQDWGAQPARYYMIDAAVALEAYDSSTPTDDAMIHPDWISYQSPVDSNYRFGDRVFASEWYLNPAFPAGDARKTLTWRDRFGNVGANTYNFYSSSEDVLREHTGNPGLRDVAEVAISQGRYSWALQEKLKGRRVSLPGGKIGSTYGGWRFSQNIVPPGIVPPWQAFELQDTTLTTNPVFDPGYTLRVSPPPPETQPSLDDVHAGAPRDWIIDLTDSAKGSATAQAHRNQLLAEMFPARTLPAGANDGVNFEDRNFNMPFLYISSRSYWPNGTQTFHDNQGNDVMEWHHSDVKTASYVHLYRLYSEFCTLGELNE